MKQVATLFKQNKQKEEKPIIKIEKESEFSIEGESKAFEELFKEKNKKSTSIVLSALEKAEERQNLAEELKNKKYERELNEWEKKNGPLIRFSTYGEKVSPSIGNIETKDTATINEPNINKNSVFPTEEEIALMRERYLKRYESIDILKLNVNSKTLIKMQYWHEIDNRNTEL